MENTDQLRKYCDAIFGLAQEVGLRTGFSVEVKPKKTPGLLSLCADGKHFAYAYFMKRGAFIDIMTAAELARKAGVIDSADFVRALGHFSIDDEPHWRFGASNSNRLKDMVSILEKICRARHQ